MYPKTIEITEVGTRDGLQSESRFIPTDQKIKFIKGFISAGLRRIEATSFVSPRAVPQLADAAGLVSATRGQGAKIAALVPNAKGAARALEAGADEMVAFISASESHSRTNLNMPIADALKAVEQVAQIADGGGRTFRSAIAVAFGCPFEGDVEPAAVSAIAGTLKGMGVRTITLGDTTGMASPRHVENVCGRLLEDHPDLRLTLHFHNTRGLGLVNVMTGLKLGIDSYESASGGLGGCPFAAGATGNICTEDLVYLMAELGIETGIDFDGVVAVAKEMERAVGRELPGQLIRSGPRSKLHSIEAVRRAVG
ncbi:hydroxymethylglutaryl-CoA lyase [Mesorhizobium sp. ANAO-SY3R2]|uniref:hydroxymethylglutaryl-CoA lyase n=1 Tax=Mesorhizobium sp. ANAO-SY3R2 TaxID=3166644 RepID=UPI0036702136